MKTPAFIIATMLCIAPLHARTDKTPIYKDAKAPIEQRISDLVGRMTLKEKILQINQYTLGLNDNANNIEDEVREVPAEIGSVIYFSGDAVMRNKLQRNAMEHTRLGIPVLFGNDIIHGYRTIYPIPLAQACSWNLDLAQRCSEVAAREARQSGVDWTFSPMIDVAHDGRWGRVAEGYGEDPYTNGMFCMATVRGYQGDTLASDHTVASCLKHYVGYGASEAGRDYVYTEVSRPTLWNTYLPPYEMGVKAGATAVMSGFNNLNGTPATCNRYTLTDILKTRWGFQGLVVSDWEAVMQLINQGVAADKKEAAQLAINAGLDLDMIDNCYMEHLESLLAEGAVSMERIDDAVSRVLRLKFKLGLFENPYTPEQAEAKRILLPQYKALAEQMAEESVVLLKNDHATLPLATNTKIALIGPTAKSQGELLGSWIARGDQSDVTTICDALKSEFSNTVSFSQGCGYDGNDHSGFAQALETARQSDVIVLCLGEKPRWSGENAPRSTLALPRIQQQLFDTLLPAGKPIVVALVNGRPLELKDIAPKASAIVELWQPGISGGRPLAGVLSGRINPSGKLAITFPYSTGQIPIYYNQMSPSRFGGLGCYLDIPSTPLYPFGHGLSYTTFEYGDIKLSTDHAALGDTIRASVTVRNTGTRDGKETVLWYINDPVCSISRPVKELKLFDKQPIKAGQSHTFAFNIVPQRDLRYLNANGNTILEPGDYRIMVADKTITLRLDK